MKTAIRRSSVLIVVVGALFAAVGLHARAQENTGERVSAPNIEVEHLKAQIAQLEDDLAQARASRADCEMTLGPVEAQFRHATSEQRWAALKADMEKARDGKFDCNPRTGECVKKPEPPKAPETKKDETPKTSGGL